MRWPCPIPITADDHRSLMLVFVGTPGGGPRLQSSAGLLGMSTEPCPEVPPAFPRVCAVSITPWPQWDGEHGARAIHRITGVPQPCLGHGKKGDISSQNSFFVTKERSIRLPTSGRVSSCRRKMTDSLLWKLEGQGRGDPSPQWQSLCR